MSCTRMRTRWLTPVLVPAALAAFGCGSSGPEVSAGTYPARPMQPTAPTTRSCATAASSSRCPRIGRSSTSNRPEHVRALRRPRGLPRASGRRHAVPGQRQRPRRVGARRAARQGATTLAPADVRANEVNGLAVESTPPRRSKHKCAPSSDCGACGHGDVRGLARGRQGDPAVVPQDHAVKRAFPIFVGSRCCSWRARLPSRRPPPSVPQGFDTCAVLRHDHAHLAITSPYTSVGVYIGGANRGARNPTSRRSGSTP